ncbi:unnamed protein product [Pleuronectes platessa]|uniref:Uncharacterized protein n=1 Tax=Pleuronectes platessa TaxID=8262 RepID=A0A9N7UA47_PLEPL|nr:unnamed protein product [Pleuronectes platessa]
MANDGATKPGAHGGGGSQCYADADDDVSGVLWFSKGQKRTGLLSLAKGGRGMNVCYHLFLLLCVNTAGVTDPLPSDNRHTETNQGVPLLEAPCFLTLPIIEDCFWPKPKPAGVVWLREKPVSWGESQLQVRGHTESGERQPAVPQDEKLAFQLTCRDQTPLRSGGGGFYAPIEEDVSRVSLIQLQCPEGSNPGFSRSGREANDDPKLDTTPESESDTASSSNFCITFLTDQK